MTSKEHAVPRLRSIFALLVALATATSLASVAWAADTTTVQADTMTLAPATAGEVIDDAAASGGKALQMRSNSVASIAVTTTVVKEIVVVARGKWCFGPPSMTVLVNDSPVRTESVKPTTWTPYSIPVSLSAGNHTIAVKFDTDFNLLGCDRSVFLDKVSIVAGEGPPPPPVTCQSSPQAATQPFADEFEGPAGERPNPQVWSYQTAGGNLQINTDKTENASLDGNGNLAINAIKERVYVWPYGWYDYTSARLHSLDKFAICYGTLRARMKIPNGQGVKPALFLLGTDIMSKGWPAAGEVDIIDSADRLSGSGMHGTGFSLANKAPFDVTGNWHEFWMRWEPDKIVTGVDNHEIATYTPASLPQGAVWPFNDHPMFPTFGVTIGGQGPPPNESTVFPATMLIDWIRYTPPSS
ncbi:family 16 glycosylhydrolase [Mycolicibacterium sp. XJ1819]